MKRAAAGVALALTLARCAPADLLNATVPTGGLTITRDVAYGANPRQTLDIYRPTAGTGLPVVVFFYGGSWRMGSKVTYPFVAATLARRGAVVVVPDYRLYPEVQFPAFLQDCALAVAWAAAHADGLGGDPGRLFLMGHSAGAYNALMLALDPEWLHAVGMAPAGLAGTVGLAGPYDFLPITGADIKPVFASVQDGPASQPITYVTGHNPPLLLLAGDDDTTVKPRNTAALAARVREAGGPVTVKTYPGLAHLGLVLAIAPAFQWRGPVLADVWGFIAAQKERIAAQKDRLGGQRPPRPRHS